MHYDRVTVVDHPMVQHKLSKLRNKNLSLIHISEPTRP